MSPDSEQPAWPIRRQGEYYVIRHSSRCHLSIAHPVSVYNDISAVWAKLLSCSDPECRVFAGKLVVRRGAGSVSQADLRIRWKKKHGKPYGYVPRSERMGMTDPKTTAQLATWMGRVERERKTKR